MIKRPVVFLAIVLSIIAVYRLTFVHTFNAFGSDMASYLMTENWILGVDPNGAQVAHFRPPLIGFMLIPFTLFLGPLTGAKVLVLLASVLPGLGLYVFAKRFVSPWWAAMSGLVFVLLPINAVITASNQITLPALGLMFWALAIMVDIAEDVGATPPAQRQWRADGTEWVPFVPTVPLRTLALPVILLVGLNQTTSGVFLVVAGACLLVAHHRGRLLAALALAGLAASPWLWFYRTNIPFLSGIYTPGIPPVNIVPVVTSLWYWVIPVLVVALFLGRRPYCYLGIPGMVLAVLGMVSVPDVPITAVFDRGLRVLQGVGVVAVVCLVTWVCGRLVWRYGVQVLLKLGLVLSSLGAGAIFVLWMSWPPMFVATATTFNFTPPESLAALDWVKANTPGDAGVMAYPDALGWYVGGYAQRKWAGVSGRGTPIRAYAERDRAFDCAMGWRDNCDPIALRNQFGFSYLVVNRNHWQSFNDDGTGWANLDRLPWLQKQATFGDVGIYQIEGQ